MEKYNVIFETTQNNSERKASPKIFHCWHPNYVFILDSGNFLVQFIHSEKLLGVISFSIAITSILWSKVKQQVLWKCENMYNAIQKSLTKEIKFLNYVTEKATFYKY